MTDPTDKQLEWAARLSLLIEPLPVQPEVSSDGMVRFKDGGWFGAHIAETALECAGYSLPHAVGDRLSVTYPAKDDPSVIHNAVLEVVAVTVKRLQGVTEEEARAAGYQEGTIGEYEERDMGGGYTMEIFPTQATAAGMCMWDIFERHSIQHLDDPWCAFTEVRKV